MHVRVPVPLSIIIFIYYLSTIYLFVTTYLTAKQIFMQFFNAYTYLLIVIVKRIVSIVPNFLRTCVHTFIDVYTQNHIHTQNLFQI